MHDKIHVPARIHSHFLSVIQTHGILCLTSVFQIPRRLILMSIANWICPNCKRPFRNKNQAHSCIRIAAASHLENKSPQVRNIYEKLSRSVRKFGTVRVSATKSSIMCVSKSTFAAVKPKQEWIDLEFLLDEKVEQYPIHKTFRANKSRVAHFVRLENPRDVNARLLFWLKQSYDLTKSA